MAYKVVCISSQDGAGGAEAARLVAEKLDFRVVDEDIVAQAAVRAGVDHGVVADVERRKSLISRLLEGMAPASLATAPVTPAPELLVLGQDSEALRQLIRSVIEETAAAGRVVLVSHAASFALSQREDVLRVLLNASPATRASRVAGELGVDESEAARRLKSFDSGRADYLKRFYRIDHEQPAHYDLVVNTDRITPAEASDLIVAAASI